MKQKVQLAIEGMHCDACVRRVTNALSGVKGVHVDSVKVGSAQVEFDPELAGPEEVTAAIDGIGFKAQIER